MAKAHCGRESSPKKTSHRESPLYLSLTSQLDITNWGRGWARCLLGFLHSWKNAKPFWFPSNIIFLRFLLYLKLQHLHTYFKSRQQKNFCNDIIESELLGEGGKPKRHLAHPLPTYLVYDASVSTLYDYEEGMSPGSHSVSRILC